MRFYQSTPTAGDCTCGYRIELDKEYTIGEFIKDILHDKNKEWGVFGIYDGKHIFGEPSFSYSDGALETPIANEILEIPVKSATCSGGWSRMDYMIHV